MANDHTRYDSGQRQIRGFRQYPMLSLDEERELVARWITTRDTKAQKKLITSHLRMVGKIALRYQGYGLPLDELLSEGQVGLTEAVNRFDPALRVRLATYALWWIRAHIMGYVLHNSSMVKMGTTAAQKKLFFSLRRVKAMIGVLTDGDLTPDQVTRIATLLTVPEKEVQNMNRRMGGDASLNAPMRRGAEGDEAEFLEFLVDDSPSPETLVGEIEESKQRKLLLDDALTTLNPREKVIFSGRRLSDPPETLESLAVTYGISRERVRQIEIAVFAKVRKYIQNQHSVQKKLRRRSS